MNPTLTNGQTDIFWRDIHEDDSIFQALNGNRSVLVLTDVMNTPNFPRVTLSKYVDFLSNEDRGSNEVVKFYAFLT
jgi:hypothetical protein